MSFEIVTDSSCNLPDELIESYGLHILPLTFLVDGTSYLSYEKGRSFDFKGFYDLMRAGKGVSTSLPNLSDSTELLANLVAAGNDILYIGFSSGLSGTYDATRLILAGLSAKYPERTLLACDTLAASLGEGLLVHYAVKMRDEGYSIEEVYNWLEENKLKLAHWFTVDDLTYLQRGGRLSKGVALVGNLLNAKPVLHTDDAGHLVPVEIVRGRRKSLRALVDHMDASADRPVEKQTIFITQSECLEEAEAVARMIDERLGGKVDLIWNLDPVIGAHCGPGTIGLFFIADKR